MEGAYFLLCSIEVLEQNYTNTSRACPLLLRTAGDLLSSSRANRPRDLITSFTCGCLATAIVTGAAKRTTRYPSHAPRSVSRILYVPRLAARSHHTAFVRVPRFRPRSVRRSTRRRTSQRDRQAPRLVHSRISQKTPHSPNDHRVRRNPTASLRGCAARTRITRRTGPHRLTV